MSDIIRCSIADESCEKFVHSSGVTVYLKPMAGYSTATAQLTVNFGSIDECCVIDGKELALPDGTAHYLEHKLFESEEKNAFELFAATGAQSNAGTGHESTMYYFTCSHNFDENLEILLNFVTQPFFTAQNVEKERGIIEQEIAMYRDSPNWRLLLGLFGGVFQNNPIRKDIAGSAESISHITAELLYDVYNAYYHPTNMQLVLVGNFDPQSVRAVCDRCLKAKAPIKTQRVKKDEPQAVVNKYVECKMEVAKPLFSLGFKRADVPEAQAIEDTLYFDLLFELMFGEMSDFYMHMRDKRLINDEFSTGTIRIRNTVMPSVSGESDNPELIQEEILKTIKHFKQNPPDRETFERLKKQIHGDNIRTFGNVQVYAQLITDSALAAGNPFAIIETAAAADYDTLLKKLAELDEDNVCLSVVKAI